MSLSLLLLLTSLSSPSPPPLPTSLPPPSSQLSENAHFFQNLHLPSSTALHRRTIFTSSPDSLFYASLRQSRFLTHDPNEANLFFVPFHSTLSTRSIARLVRGLRSEFPYWNRTLGADHFYLSSSGIGYSSDRNVVELKKNSVQISSFPTISGLFIPHKDQLPKFLGYVRLDLWNTHRARPDKDITLPPVAPLKWSRHLRGIVFRPENDATKTYLGYMKKSESENDAIKTYLVYMKKSESVFVDELINDPAFAIEAEPSGKSSKFCLFLYDDMTWMVEAMALGCVPVVITDRPIQDMPLMDLLKWSEIGVFVGTDGGADGLKEVLGRIDEVDYDRMRESCVTASQHLVWNDVPQPHDAFQMVMYQLWLRRHTIRYARLESV